MSNHQELALITGASAGIGATYAQRLARRGYSLVLVARDAARLHRLAAELRAAFGVEVEVLPADLASETGLALVEQRLAAAPAITLFINNAGIGYARDLLGMAPERINAVIQLNVLASTRLAAAAGRVFAARNQGSIVNVASVLALVTEFLNPVYNASKAFVLSLSQSMQRELSPSGVYVQALLPGATRTEIFARAGDDISIMPPERVMEVEEMVDAALAGFDAREAVTIPSLPDPAAFEAFTQARLALGPNLSRNHAAARYRLGRAA